MRFMRWILCPAMAAAALLLTGANAQAAFSSISLNQHVKVNHGIAGDNGEFRITTTSGNYLIDSFCVERNENITIGASYYASFSNVSDRDRGINGDLSATVGNVESNTLMAKAAALYKQFAVKRNVGAGTGTNNFTIFGQAYDATPDQGDSNELQGAIWYFQKQFWDTSNNNVYAAGPNGGYKYGNAYVLGMNKYIDAVNAIAGPLDIAGVFIMNLTTGINGTGTKVQSQMYWDQTQVNDVPEPSTAVLFGLGLLGAVYARRRRVA